MAPHRFDQPHTASRDTTRAKVSGGRRLAGGVLALTLAASGAGCAGGARPPVSHAAPAPRARGSQQRLTQASAHAGRAIHAAEHTSGVQPRPSGHLMSRRAIASAIKRTIAPMAHVLSRQGEAPAEAVLKVTRQLRALGDDAQQSPALNSLVPDLDGTVIRLAALSRILPEHSPAPLVFIDARLALENLAQQAIALLESHSAHAHRR
jgi:hypothetical protein